jgi:hypothetical protein
MTANGDISGIADFYRRFAELEAHGSSKLYEELAYGVADDAELLTLLGGLPPIKVQPNLLFAAARFVNGTPSGFEEFRQTTLDNRATVIDTMLTRRTQTNEVARTSHVLPLLAALPQPLALLEVGASAGLCLFPDLYRHDYGYATAGDPDSTLTLTCAVDGPVRPAVGPIQVAWRAGIDLNPLDVTNADDVAWLENLVWPGQEDRLKRLRAAVAIVAPRRPRIVAGDLLADLDDVVAEAPRDATLVVMHSSTLVYVPRAIRDAFAARMATLDGHWISQEGAGITPGSAYAVGDLPNSQPPRSGALATVSLDGSPKAVAAPHGGWIHWLA